MDNTSTSASIRAVNDQFLFQMAKKQFISNHFWEVCYRIEAGYAGSVVPLLGNTKHNCYYQAFLACIMASLAVRQDNNQVLYRPRARVTYEMAKLATETTLKVPEVAKQDATLASILLLDLANRILPRKMDFYTIFPSLSTLSQTANHLIPLHLAS